MKMQMMQVLKTEVLSDVNEKRARKLLAFAVITMTVAVLVTYFGVPIISRIQDEMRAWELETKLNAYYRGVAEAELDYLSGTRALKSPPALEERTRKNARTWPLSFATSKYVEGYNTRMNQLLASQQQQIPIE